MSENSNATSNTQLPVHANIHDSVLTAIEQGRVKMRPRWQFILRAAILVCGVVLAALALLFVGSFIVFILHQNGSWYGTAFGSSGFKELFFALPVVFILVAAVFIILLQILVRRYSFAYGRPVLYSLIGVTLFLGLGSFAVSQSHLHEGLFRQAWNDQLPVVGGFYRQFGAPGDSDRITPGIITETRANGFDMNDPHHVRYTVVISAETKIYENQDLEAGDNVIVLGDRTNHIIEAEGIREIEPRIELFESRCDEDCGPQNSTDREH